MSISTSLLTTFFGIVTLILIIQEQKKTRDGYDDIEDISSCVQNINDSIYRINFKQENNSKLIHSLEKKLDSFVEINSRELNKIKSQSSQHSNIIRDEIHNKHTNNSNSSKNHTSERYNCYKELRDDEWF